MGFSIINLPFLYTPMKIPIFYFIHHVSSTRCLASSTEAASAMDSMPLSSTPRSMRMNPAWFWVDPKLEVALDLHYQQMISAYNYYS